MHGVDLFDFVCAVSTALPRGGHQRGSRLDDCVCDSGFSGPDGGPCVACPAGSYKGNSVYDAIYPQSCVPCPANTFSEAQAATILSTCLPCITSSSSLEGSFSITQCRCLAGYDKSENSCVS